MNSGMPFVWPALALVLAGVTGPVPARAAGAAIAIENFTFSPPAITVATGTTVTWTNADDIPHRVVSDSLLFKSPALDTKDQFSFTFSKPGVYSYFCSLHPRMTGKIFVKPG